MDQNSTECIKKNPNFPYCIHFDTLEHRRFCSQLKPLGTTVDKLITKVQEAGKSISNNTVVLTGVAIVEGVGPAVAVAVKKVAPVVTNIIGAIAPGK